MPVPPMSTFTVFEVLVDVTEHWLDWAMVSDVASGAMMLRVRYLGVSFPRSAGICSTALTGSHTWSVVKS